jgi:hypothetical protein
MNIDSEYRILFNVVSLNSKHTHAVFEVGTGRLLCLTNWLETAKAMESEDNTRVWYFINNSKKLPKIINVNLPFEYVFDNITSSFYKKDIPEEETQKYLTLSEKSAVYDILHRILNRERKHIQPALAMQEIVYAMKLKEAYELISGETYHPDAHPYVRDYSSLKNISPFEAAQRIINKDKLQKSRLVETESIRMKYISLLKSCTDLIQVNELHDEMVRETSIYGGL